MVEKNEEDKEVKIISNRLVWAEGQMIRDQVRDRSSEKKHRWEKVRCPKCTNEVTYEPIPGKWDGNLHCPHCGHDFKISVLTDYVEEVK